MPIYEYVCRECGEELERLQRMSDAPLTDCPACGQAALAKKVSAAGFRLKGSGWYETDFKSSGKKNLAGEAKADSKSGGKSDTKASSDSKPKADSSKSTSTASSAA
ncbi:MAG: zinc ribbon domain-containing protein [Salinisphaeraceae bacterium]|nr:zinc ribbon domain-containing protein [Salinisphaeraceae bacterium]